MSPPSPYPHAIIFDLLTALLDSWTLWNTAAGTSDAGRRWRARYLELTYGCGAYVPYESLVERAAADTGLPPSAPAALLASWDNLQPWPEAPAVLAKLRARGAKIGIITNCSILLGRRAAALCEAACSRGQVRGNVEGVELPTADGSHFPFRFDAVVTSEEAGFYKPDDRAYEAVLEKLGVRAEEAVFVAGSAADVPGASGAGIPRVVWHNRVGLVAKDGAPAPLREGKTLEEALEGFL